MKPLNQQYKGEEIKWHERGIVHFMLYILGATAFYLILEKLFG